MHSTRKRSVRLFGASVLLVGGIGVPVLFGAEGAQAAVCGTADATGVSCTMTGTFVLGAGALGLTPPASLGWAGPVTGVDQAFADLTAADQTYLVNDSSGAGAGWSVSVSATPFTLTTSDTTLPLAGTFQTNGSVTDETDLTSPTASCSAATACTLPTNGTIYPVDITTVAGVAPAGDIFTIYDAAAGTGLGSIIIGGSTEANPVGWWLNVPANTLAGTYTSTITMAIVDAP
jgi:WxL domain surface cell wall-binding